VGQIVIGYLINQLFPVFALVGPKTLTDLKDSIGCPDTKLSKEDIQYLEHGETQRL
jgi:aryl-alcohol dehydrogenase-like predicted oxidoreductase